MMVFTNHVSLETLNRFTQNKLRKCTFKIYIIPILKFYIPLDPMV